MDAALESGAVLNWVQSLVHRLVSIMSERRRLRDRSAHCN
jgi:hypothetical protein